MTTITRFNLLLLAFTIGLSTGAGRVMPAKNETKGASSAAFHAGREGDPVEKMFLIYFEILFGSIIVALTTYRLITLLIQHVRTLACLKNDTQRYFAVPNDNWARIKQHVMYAPVFRTRHNREFRLSEATHFGTLPTRFQALVLVTYLGTNMIFCAVSIPWADERKRALTVFRDRTGVLAVANMLPLFLMAGRNNPLVPMLGISFDTFNLIHRWVGRMVVLEAICHSTAFMIVEVSIGKSKPEYRTIRWRLIYGSRLGRLEGVDCAQPTDPRGLHRTCNSCCCRDSSLMFPVRQLLRSSYS